MSSEQPPNPIVDTFNPEYWRITADGGITTEYLDDNYLKFPLSQTAQETFTAIPNCSASQPVSTDSSSKIPTTAWVQSAIPAISGLATLAGTNAFTGTNSFTILTSNSATMPLATDSGTTMPTTAWVQSAIDASQDTGNITENNTNATFYPVFVSATGTTTFNANSGTTPFSLNPNTGDFNVSSTLQITQDTIAMGVGTALSSGTGCVALGLNAGNASQATNSVAVGSSAGQTTQGGSCVAVGSGAGNANQGGNSVAIGGTAGNTAQGASCVAVGTRAGNANQSDNCVAVGSSAGQSLQASSATALGNFAGNANQGTNCVAVGTNAGEARQGTGSVAIGNGAGNDRQGRNSVAIGAGAGDTLQNDNTIVLNATGAPINGDIGASRLLVAPIRGVALGAGVGVLIYDPATFEIVYSTS